jgi:hypothetical protein
VAASVDELMTRHCLGGDRSALELRSPRPQSDLAGSEKLHTPHPPNPPNPPNPPTAGLRYVPRQRRSTKCASPCVSLPHPFWPIFARFRSRPSNVTDVSEVSYVSRSFPWVAPKILIHQLSPLGRSPISVLAGSSRFGIMPNLPYCALLRSRWDPPGNPPHHANRFRQSPCISLYWRARIFAAQLSTWSGFSPHRRHSVACPAGLGNIHLSHGMPNKMTT